MACDTVRGGLLARLGPWGLAWLLGLGVAAAYFGYEVGSNDRGRAAGAEVGGP